jgi:NAD(P)-dependent dehydrogenase (short-subunit alcohol dehydrogenase family)
MQTVFITGISRGIGLALTKLALERGDHVIGVARNPEDSPELVKLQTMFKELKVISLDLCQDDAAEKMISELTEVPVLDILINNAGVYEHGTSKQSFLKSFEVNSYVPFMVTEALLTKLKKSPFPKLVNISSVMGGITDNYSGDSYAYRSSKSALNMIHKCLSLEYDWLTCVAIHPGWVKTDMGGDGAQLLPKTSAIGIWDVISKIRLDDSGSFVDHKGHHLRW